MEGEDIAGEEAVRQNRLDRVNTWQTIRAKRLRRWFRRLRRRIEARQEYVRERDSKRQNE